MRLFPEVKKRINPFMKSRGFKIHNRRYYYIKNDIAFCICFEQPTGLLYTWAHINPLYISQEVLYLTYGNRINNMADINLPLLTILDCDPGTIDTWCEMLCHCIDDYILPYFNQIDTPEKLLSYVEEVALVQQDSHTGRMGRNTLQLQKLRAYTYLYLHDFEKASCAVECYRQEIEEASDCFSAPILENWLSKAALIQQLISGEDEEVTRYCNQTIEQTKKLFRPKQRKGRAEATG